MYPKELLYNYLPNPTKFFHILTPVLLNLRKFSTLKISKGQICKLLKILKLPSLAQRKL